MLTIIIEILLSIGIIGAGIYIKKINEKIEDLNDEIHRIKMKMKKDGN